MRNDGVLAFVVTRRKGVLGPDDPHTKAARRWLGALFASRRLVGLFAAFVAVADELETLARAAMLIGIRVERAQNRLHCAIMLAANPTQAFAAACCCAVLLARFEPAVPAGRSWRTTLTNTSQTWRGKRS